MNDDELRDHLRATLEPVAPPSPELARLRRLARRRRRRLQLASSGLAVALLAGAGVGIAVATNGGPNRSELTVGSPPPTSTVVTVPCHSGQLTLAVGQKLRVVGCQPGQELTSYTQSTTTLRQTGPAVFDAVAVGDGTKIGVYPAGGSPCGSPTMCGPAPPVIAISVTVVAPGHSSAPVLVASFFSAPCKGGHVGMFSGGELILANCPVGVSSHIDDPAVLAPGTSPNTFTAKKVGTTNVELFVKPVCSPGMMCPQNIRDLGTLVVTVTPAG